MAKQTLWPTGGKRRAAGRGQPEMDGEERRDSEVTELTRGMESGGERNDRRWPRTQKTGLWRGYELTKLIANKKWGREP